MVAIKSEHYLPHPQQSKLADMTAALTWTKLDPPRLHCEGRGDLNNVRRHEFCAGGTGAWVSRRARWERSDGMMQCGTCKRADELHPLDAPSGPPRSATGLRD